MQQPLIEKPQVKKIIGIDRNLLSLSLLNFFLNAAVSLIVPFYPTLANKRKVNATIQGLVFAIHPIGSFLISFYIGSMMERLGKKKIMLISMMIQVITIVSFGLLYYINDKNTFIIISMVTRFIQGASRSAYGSVTFGYVPQLWPTQVQQKIAIMETLTALGLLFGPMIGQSLNNLISLQSESMGYQMPFYILGFFFIAMSFTIMWLPQDTKQVSQQDQVSVFKSMSNRPTFFTFLVVVTAATSATFINTLYTDHLKNLGLNSKYVGFVFSLGALFYMVFLYVIPQMSKVMDKKLILFLGLFTCSIGCLIMAPEKYLGLSSGGDKWYLVTIGQCIIGAAQAMCIIPMIPELIELIIKNELITRKILQPNPLLIKASCDMASGIFVGGYSLGIFFGPFFGGLMKDQFNNDKNSVSQEIDAFQKICRIFALVTAVILLLYVCLGQGYLGFSKLKIFQKKVKTQSSENVIQQRNNNQESKDQSNINTTSQNIVNTATVIPKQDIPCKLSDHTDELLSDQSPVPENFNNYNEQDENNVVKLQID